jgi:hypothetical protein
MVLKLEPQTEPMPRMRRENYLQHARKSFLEGSRCCSPMEAVDAGERSILEWCACLNRSRLMYSMASETVSEIPLDQLQESNLPSI